MSHTHDLSSEGVIEEHVCLLRNLINESHLEQLINDLEHEVLRVEVVELCAHPLVDIVERQATLRLLQLVGDKVAQFVPLIADLVHVLVCLALQAVEESFFFELVDALLEHLSCWLVTILAKAQLSLDFGDELWIRKDFLDAESLVRRCILSIGYLLRTRKSILCLWCALARVFEEEPVVVVEDEVIDALLDSLERVMDETFITTACHVLYILGFHVVWLLQRGLSTIVLSLLLFEQATLEWFVRIKVDSLGHQALLVLQHFLTNVSN